MKTLLKVITGLVVIGIIICFVNCMSCFGCSPIDKIKDFITGGK